MENSLTHKTFITEMRILQYFEPSMKLLLHSVAVNYSCRFVGLFFIIHIHKYSTI